MKQEQVRFVYQTEQQNTKLFAIGDYMGERGRWVGGWKHLVSTLVISTCIYNNIVIIERVRIVFWDN